MKRGFVLYVIGEYQRTREQIPSTAAILAGRMLTSSGKERGIQTVLEGL